MGDRVVELAKAIIYGAAGSALFELFKQWMLAPEKKVDSEPVKLPTERQVAMFFKPLGMTASLERSSFFAMQDMRRREAGEIAGRLGLDAGEVLRFLNISAQVNETISIVDRMVRFAVLQSGHEFWRGDFDGVPLVTLRLVTAIGEKRPSEELLAENAAAEEAALLAEGFKPEDFIVDLDAFTPIEWEEYRRLG